jgi:hypothetical protein
MSTSDRQEQGPLTRKQLREIRLTGSTPVITPEEAAAAAASAPPAPPEPRAAEPADPTPVPAPSDAGAATRLTRRQVRELERSRSGSDAESETDADAGPSSSNDVDGAHSDESPADDSSTDAHADESAAEQEKPSVPADDVDDADDDIDEEIAAAPVSAAARAHQASDVSVVPEQNDVSDEADAALSDAEPATEDDAEEARPVVSSTFGQGVLEDQAEPAKPFTPSFDELLTVGDSTGSQHRGGNTLIFNPAPGDGSLSGPVASTGEILVTGSYELPKGLGSQGHAHGTTDGKEVDAVLIDGELPPASSPTPIAASAAVSTIKPAGEVLRPPAPEKGNKLMLILAIVAGGLALALGVALIVAFTGNVF